jgi:hypothetical protein
MPVDAGSHDLGRHIFTRPIAAKGQERLLGLSLLMDVDAVRLDRVGCDNKVATTR